MDFVTSHFGKMNLWPVEHFSTYLSSKLDSSLIKILERIRLSSNQKLGEGESNFDNEYVENSVELVRGSSFRNDLLQNPYFKVIGASLYNAQNNTLISPKSVLLTFRTENSRVNVTGKTQLKGFPEKV